MARGAPARGRARHHPGVGRGRAGEDRARRDAARPDRGGRGGRARRARARRVLHAAAQAKPGRLGPRHRLRPPGARRGGHTPRGDAGRARARRRRLAGRMAGAERGARLYRGRRGGACARCSRGSRCIRSACGRTSTRPAGSFWPRRSARRWPNDSGATRPTHSSRPPRGALPTRARSLREELLGAPELDGRLREADLDELLDPANYLGCADALIDRALARHEAER